MRSGDRVVIGFVIVLALASLPLAAYAGGDRTDGVVVHSPAGLTSLPMAEDRTLEVAGARGSVMIEVSGGRARVVHADCPDKVCVHSGWSSAGRPVVCAPNGVVIESGGGESLDAVSR